MTEAMRLTNSECVRSLICLIVSNLSVESDNLRAMLLDQSCFYDALLQIVNSSNTLVFQNAEYVLHNFVVTASHDHIYQMNQLLKHNWQGERDDYLVGLVQTMLRRKNSVNSQFRGLHVLRHLLEVEEENNHEMGVFHFCEELAVEQDLNTLSMSSNSSVQKEASELLEEFLGVEKEEFGQEYAVRRNSIKFDEQF